MAAHIRRRAPGTREEESKNAIIQLSLMQEKEETNKKIKEIDEMFGQFRKKSYLCVRNSEMKS